MGLPVLIEESGAELIIAVDERAEEGAIGRLETCSRVQVSRRWFIGVQEEPAFRAVPAGLQLLDGGRVRVSEPPIDRRLPLVRLCGQLRETGRGRGVRQAAE